LSLALLLSPAFGSPKERRWRGLLSFRTFSCLFCIFIYLKIKSRFAGGGEYGPLSLKEAKREILLCLCLFGPLSLRERGPKGRE